MPHKIDGGTKGKKYSVTAQTEADLAGVARWMGGDTSASEALRLLAREGAEKRGIPLVSAPVDTRQLPPIEDAPDLTMANVRAALAKTGGAPLEDVTRRAFKVPLATPWPDPFAQAQASPPLGERMRVKREVDGLTRGELAAKLGSLLSVIEGMEDGTLPLTPAATAWLGPVRELKPGESLWPEDIGAPLPPGERLKAARLAAGFERTADLGRHLEISRSTVDRAERGQQVPLGDVLSAWLERREKAAAK